MSARFSLALILSLTLVASPLRAAPPTGSCRPARAGASVATLPAAWRAAVTSLIASTAEPGHPWSCGGGTIDLAGEGGRISLRVAREGEAGITRSVASPEDVVPLGEALLANPVMLSAPDPAASAVPPSLPAPPEKALPSATSPVPAPEVSPASGPSPPAGSTDPVHERTPPRILLGAGVDARWVGGPDLPWGGPLLWAALPAGRWSPTLVLRQQSALSRRPHLDEVSAAIALDRSFGWDRWALRVGAFVRGASVQRDVPGTRGEQSRIEGRGGLGAALVVPVHRWLRIVGAVNGEVVVVSHERSHRTTTTGEEPPRPFPTHTLGGSLGVEAAL